MTIKELQTILSRAAERYAHIAQSQSENTLQNQKWAESQSAFCLNLIQALEMGDAKEFRWQLDAEATEATDF